jgi:hypothetical protein
MRTTGQEKVLKLFVCGNKIELIFQSLNSIYAVKGLNLPDVY